MPPARKAKASSTNSNTNTNPPSTPTTTSIDEAPVSATGAGGDGWTEPPWNGFLETTEDALLILEAAKRRLIPRVTRRLAESERKLITSGSVFVFEEEESGIKRWTDGFLWSPSRILGNFLLYRETDKRHPDGTPITRPGTRPHNPSQSTLPSSSNVTPSTLLVLSPDTPNFPANTYTQSQTSSNSFSRPKSTALSTNEGTAYSASGTTGMDRQTEKLLFGSLTNSQKFKEDGMMKKTFSLTLPTDLPSGSSTSSGAGKTHHLVSYYKVVDVEAGRLRTPSSLPEFKALEISPEFLDKTHFRVPPRVEVGEDGRVRFRGETATTPDSPDSPLPPPPPPPSSSAFRSHHSHHHSHPHHGSGGNNSSSSSSAPNGHSHSHSHSPIYPRGSQSHQPPPPPPSSGGGGGGGGGYGQPQYTSYQAAQYTTSPTTGAPPYYPSGHARRMSSASSSSHRASIGGSGGMGLAAQAAAQAEASKSMYIHGAAVAAAVNAGKEVCYQQQQQAQGGGYSNSLMNAMGPHHHQHQSHSHPHSSHHSSSTSGSGSGFRRTHHHRPSYDSGMSSTGAPPFQAPQLYDPTSPSASANSAHFVRAGGAYPAGLAPSVRSGPPSVASGPPSVMSGVSVGSAVRPPPSLVSGSGSGSSGSSEMVSEAVTPSSFGHGSGMVDPTTLNKMLAQQQHQQQQQVGGGVGVKVFDPSTTMFDFNAGGMGMDGGISLASPLEMDTDPSATATGGNWCGKDSTIVQQSYGGQGGGFASPMGVSPSHTAPIHQHQLHQSPTHTGNGNGGYFSGVGAGAGMGYNIPPPPPSTTAPTTTITYSTGTGGRPSFTPSRSQSYSQPYTAPNPNPNASYGTYNTTPTESNSSASLSSSPSVDFTLGGGGQMAQAMWGMGKMMDVDVGAIVMNMAQQQQQQVGVGVGVGDEWTGGMTM